MKTPSKHLSLPPSRLPWLHLRKATAWLIAGVGLGVTAAAGEPASSTARQNAPTAFDLWAHDNLIAWCVVPFDARKRGPVERADMLAGLGFRHFAYDWRAEHVPTFDAELDALAAKHIDLLAWWFPFDPEDPAALATLEVFKRHGVHPQLWVMQSSKKPASGAPTGSEDPATRIAENATRIAGLAKLAAPYGCRIGLYNHNGWFGLMDNQVAILDRLKVLGVTDVGLVYNFSHARDPMHDDTTDFPALWRKIQPHVMAVNVTGMRMEGKLIYPSQGDRELDMMRTIQESGWKGLVGLIAEKGGDAAVTLKNYLTGLDWLAAELKQPGSGGPRPFPEAP